jgi:hypothetical protein
MNEAVNITRSTEQSGNMTVEITTTSIDLTSDANDIEQIVTAMDRSENKTIDRNIKENNT